MTDKEQYEWLVRNGFQDNHLGHGNRIIYSKPLQFGREMWFTWHNANSCWNISIYEDVDYSCILVQDIPNTGDFTKFQPLIDLIV